MNTPKGKILVNGSVVFDTILKKEFYGGTGANIAYGLGKFKVFPMLFSVVGKDFAKDFGPHLEKSGVDLRAHIEEKLKTASYSYLTNQKGEPIEKWMPNAYKKINKISLTETIGADELKNVSIAIFSTGTPESTYKHLREFRNFAGEALTIFDPGQMVTYYSKKQFVDCLNLAEILILNEFEYKQVKIILGKDPVVFFSKKNKINKIIIQTEGEKGSIIFQNGRKIKVPAVKPRQVLDTTGAGDAYRAGLIFGLSKNFSLVKACRLGAQTASKNIAFIGCQKY